MKHAPYIVLFALALIGGASMAGSSTTTEPAKTTPCMDCPPVEATAPCMDCPPSTFNTNL